MSTPDHPDWWVPVGGLNSAESVLERRSTIWNDNGVVPPAAPPSSTFGSEYRGKFFTRGCRGKIEQIQVYCRRDAAGTIELRYSPHPCLGPFDQVTITPGAAWAWVAVNIEEMWNYDSLFLWLYDVDADVWWGYDTALPYDGHYSADAGATWTDTPTRPFIRVIYSGETPGDVPISGIVNNIPIPNVGSYREKLAMAVPINTPTTVVDIDGAGSVDLVFCHVAAAAASVNTVFRFYCDDIYAYGIPFITLNAYGITPATPGVSLTTYALNGVCVQVVTKRFEFRRRFHINAFNAAGPVVATVYAHPTLLR